MDADERTQPESRIQRRIFSTDLGLTHWETAIRDEGSGGLTYTAGMAGMEGGPGLSQGEYVRTLYGKGASRYLFRAV